MICVCCCPCCGHTVPLEVHQTLHLAITEKVTWIEAQASGLGKATRGLLKVPNAMPSVLVLGETQFGSVGGGLETQHACSRMTLRTTHAVQGIVCGLCSLMLAR